MSELWRIQNFISIESAQLFDKVQDLKAANYRLIQICCTTMPDCFEMLYSFDKDHKMLNLKFYLQREEEIMSITGAYWAAFILENEIQDLFGVKFKHMALNYGGNFFKVSQPTPWNPKD